jgi:hypothetical protein
MAAAEKTVGEKFWGGARLGAGLYAGLELIAFLINPAFAMNMLVAGAFGGVIAGTFGILALIKNSVSKPSSA